MTETEPESSHEESGETVTETPKAEPKRPTRVREPFDRDKAMAQVNQVRSLLARVVWIVCVLIALSLAVVVLFIAIQARTQNDLVENLYHFTTHVDLKYFSLTDPIKDFDTKGKNSAPAKDIKTALFNYGVCAIIWLVIGRIADMILRPSGNAPKSR